MGELDDYDYELPPELIAQTPLPQRSDARLLVVNRREQSLEHGHVRDLAAWLRPGDCLVLNDTRVIPARLVGRRDETGGRWTGLFLSADPSGMWRVICKTRGRLRAGESITLHDREGRASCRLRLLTQLEPGEWAVRPEEEEERSALEVLERVGRVPLPPYIRGGEMTDSDRPRYQTVFAERPGAVAAPTAGLHFTDSLLARLRDAGVVISRVTLHVGVGTFRPISAQRLHEHPMHAEWGRIDAETARELRARRASGARIVAVGTTVVRVLETAAACGTLDAWEGHTRLFIRPPFTFRAVDVLLTNFHLPRSTLLVLVHAFAGHALVRRAYQEAIAERYRFYSYGDAMLIV